MTDESDAVTEAEVEAFLGTKPTAAQLDAYVRAKEAQAVYRADLLAREAFSSGEWVRAEPLALRGWYERELDAQIPLVDRLTPPSAPDAAERATHVLDALMAEPRIVFLGRRSKPDGEGKGIG